MLVRNSSPDVFFPAFRLAARFRPVFLVVREGDDLRAPLRLDGEVDHADRARGASALLDAELVGPPHVFQDLAHFLLLPLLVAEVALKRRL